MPNPLRTKLRSIVSDKETDEYLSELWRSFRGSNHYNAVLMALEDVEQAAEAALLSPRTGDVERAHAAGQVAACRRLMITFDTAIAFDPSSAAYETDEEEPLTSDPFTII